MAASLDHAERILDVVIIGAGISGLSAAYELQKKRPHTKFVILEAKGLLWGKLLAWNWSSVFGAHGSLWHFNNCPLFVLSWHRNQNF